MVLQVQEIEENQEPVCPNWGGLIKTSTPRGRNWTHRVSKNSVVRWVDYLIGLKSFFGGV